MTDSIGATRRRPCGCRVLTRVQVTAIGLLCALVLAGCVADGSSGQSQDFQAGYAAGCYNGKIAAGLDLPYTDPDPNRYGVNQQYTEGWKAGYTECFEQYRDFPMMGQRHS
jgi:hypothetical protein